MNFQTALETVKQLPEAMVIAALEARGYDPAQATAEGETYQAALARLLVEEHEQAR